MMQTMELDWQQVKHYLAPRPAHCYKGDFGHVLVIGGAPGFNGAARLAAEAAARIGAGLISVATHPDHAAILNSGCPELMCHAVANPNALQPLLNKATVIALGPGLGCETWGACLADEVLKITDKPLVIDADGLRHLAKQPQKIPNAILTPHVGEAAILLGVDTKEIQADRAAAIQKMQDKFGGIVVLKGSAAMPTLIFDGDRLASCCYGNSAMASGGMGDALTGIIAGLVAQGLTPMQAAELGVVIHAKAADYLVASKHYRTLLVHDIVDFLPFVMDML